MPKEGLCWGISCPQLILAGVLAQFFSLVCASLVQFFSVCSHSPEHYGHFGEFFVQKLFEINLKFRYQRVGNQKKWGQLTYINFKCWINKPAFIFFRIFTHWRLKLRVVLNTLRSIFRNSNHCDSWAPSGGPTTQLTTAVRTVGHSGRCMPRGIQCAEGSAYMDCYPPFRLCTIQSWAGSHACFPSILYSLFPPLPSPF